MRVFTDFFNDFPASFEVMSVNRRRKARRALDWVTAVACTLDGTPIASCAVRDVSETGARLEVEDPRLLPNEFILHLAGNGKVLRRCRVVWRKRDEVGVRYLAGAGHSDVVASGTHSMG